MSKASAKWRAASTSSKSWPWRITPLSVRAPESNPKAPRSTLLPAPVSPVTAVKPDSNSSVTSSSRARFFIRMYFSMQIDY